MASFSGTFHRPLSAAAAATIAAVSSDIPDKLPHPRSTSSSSSTKSSNCNPVKSFIESKSWVSRISVSKLANPSFSSRIETPLAKLDPTLLNVKLPFSPNVVLHNFSFSVASPTVLMSLYQSAKLLESPPPVTFKTSPPTGVVHIWHMSRRSIFQTPENSECAGEKSQTVVVLLGWLGAKQKHLKRYADWYTSRGFHVVTFTFPMADVINYRVGGKVEQYIDLLARDLVAWVGQEHGKNLVFHTFSNTGWLTYGVILEKFQIEHSALTDRIKGCIIDSAPAATPDPQVWASGFSAAILKKQSVGQKRLSASLELRKEESAGSTSYLERKTEITEMALLKFLERFFEVVLNLPTINRRLSDVVSVLSKEQPKCPQLYIYSSADRVIPSKYVESFIEEQIKAGHQVRAFNFKSSPHVDHYRNHPDLYTEQLAGFLQDLVITCCNKNSS